MSKKDTQKEPVEDQSLDDALRAAFHSAEGVEDEVEDSTPEDDVEAEEDSEPTGDEAEADESSEDGEDESDGSGEDDQGEYEAEEGGSDDQEIEALEPPQHWSAEDRQTFTGVPREAQEFLLKRHKEMEADYTRKTQEVATTRRALQEQEQILAPIAQDLALAGADSNAFIRQQVAWAQAFKADPQSAITRLAGAYGLDLSQVAQGQEDLDPQVAAMQQELAQMRAQQQQSLEAQQQTEQQRLQNVIDDFAKATDDAGNLKYPHFADIQADMGQVIQAGMAEGLEDAYAKVVAMKGLQAPAPQPTQAPKAKPKKSDDRKAKVRRAKRAATGVRSSGTPAKPASEDMSLHDEIASLIDQSS